MGTQFPFKEAKSPAATSNPSSATEAKDQIADRSTVLHIMQLQRDTLIWPTC